MRNIYLQTNSLGDNEQQDNLSKQQVEHDINSMKEFSIKDVETFRVNENIQIMEQQEASGESVNLYSAVSSKRRQGHNIVIPTNNAPSIQH